MGVKQELFAEKFFVVKSPFFYSLVAEQNPIR
ncbi:MAG: hypothetical protein JWO06_4118 [Bacteroidota bacterium]|nr:hypothetical protein [Bacteroidota bacterium]